VAIVLCIALRSLFQQIQPELWSLWRMSMEAFTDEPELLSF